MSQQVTGAVKKLYRAAIPVRVRQHPWVVGLKKLLERTLPHDLVYDADYYRSAVEAAAESSAGPIAAAIKRDLAPALIVDVGCGTGALLAAFRQIGVGGYGLEYSKAGLAICYRRGLDVTRFDIEKDDREMHRRADVVVSMEVAEHLPETVADRYVDLLVGLADVVVMTAAPPGQGGTDHVNEQPKGYWQEKFLRRGFQPWDKWTSRWQAEWEMPGGGRVVLEELDGFSEDRVKVVSERGLVRNAFRVGAEGLRGRAPSWGMKKRMACGRFERNDALRQDRSSCEGRTGVVARW